MTATAQLETVLRVMLKNTKEYMLENLKRLLLTNKPS